MGKIVTERRIRCKGKCRWQILTGVNTHGTHCPLLCLSPKQLLRAGLIDRSRLTPLAFLPRILYNCSLLAEPARSLTNYLGEVKSVLTWLLAAAIALPRIFPAHPILRKENWPHKSRSYSR